MCRGQIFLTHVKRGAPCELALMGGAPRIQVVEKLTRPSDITVYDAAQGMAFDALATQVHGKAHPQTLPVWLHAVLS